MLSQEAKVRIFGLGLALLLLVGTLVHLLQLHPKIIPMIIIIGFIFFVIDKALTFRWLYASVYLLLLGWTVLFIKDHSVAREIIWIEMTGIFFLIAGIFNLSILSNIYNLWMKCAHVIALVVTGFILSTVYFLLFTPIRLVLFLFGKDHLHRSFKRDVKSYWIVKESVEVNKDRYKQQF